MVEAPKVHVHMSVSNLEKSRAFYEKFLGVDLLRGSCVSERKQKSAGRTNRSRKSAHGDSPLVKLSVSA